MQHGGAHHDFHRDINHSAVGMVFLAVRYGLRYGRKTSIPVRCRSNSIGQIAETRSSIRAYITRRVTRNDSDGKKD